MLADDFIGRVALEPFGADDSRLSDDAARIEHIDGVVGHTLHQSAEPALAFQQRVLLAFRSVMSRVILAKPMCRPPCSSWTL